MGWGFENASRPLPESTLRGGSPGGLSRPARSPKDCLWLSLHGNPFQDPAAFRSPDIHWGVMEDGDRHCQICIYSPYN